MTVAGTSDEGLNGFNGLSRMKEQRHEWEASPSCHIVQCVFLYFLFDVRPFIRSIRCIRSNPRRRCPSSAVPLIRPIYSTDTIRRQVAVGHHRTR